jgi:hypothetical protein
MNGQRRKEISKAIALLQQADEFLKQAAEILEFERDGEQETFDNMSESQQGSDRGYRAQENISALENAVDELANFEVETVVGYLEEVSQ